MAQHVGIDALTLHPRLEELAQHVALETSNLKARVSETLSLLDASLASGQLTLPLLVSHVTGQLALAKAKLEQLSQELILSLLPLDASLTLTHGLLKIRLPSSLLRGLTLSVHLSGQLLALEPLLHELAHEVGIEALRLDACLPEISTSLHAGLASLQGCLTLGLVQLLIDLLTAKACLHHLLKHLSIDAACPEGSVTLLSTSLQLSLASTQGSGLAGSLKITSNPLALCPLGQKLLHHVGLDTGSLNACLPETLTGLETCLPCTEGGGLTGSLQVAEDALTLETLLTELSEQIGIDAARLDACCTLLSTSLETCLALSGHGLALSLAHGGIKLTTSDATLHQLTD